MAPESHGALRSVEQRQRMWSSDTTEVRGAGWLRGLGAGLPGGAGCGGQRPRGAPGSCRRCVVVQLASRVIAHRACHFACPTLPPGTAAAGGQRHQRHQWPAADAGCQRRGPGGAAVAGGGGAGHRGRRPAGRQRLGAHALCPLSRGDAERLHCAAHRPEPVGGHGRSSWLVACVAVKGRRCACSAQRPARDSAPSPDRGHLSSCRRPLRPLPAPPPQLRRHRGQRGGLHPAGARGPPHAAAHRVCHRAGGSVELAPCLPAAAAGCMHCLLPQRCWRRPSRPADGGGLTSTPAARLPALRAAAVLPLQPRASTRRRWRRAHRGPSCSSQRWPGAQHQAKKSAGTVAASWCGPPPCAGGLPSAAAPSVPASSHACRCLP